MPNKVVPVPEKETIASKIIDTFNNLMFLNPDHDICEDVCPQICDYFGGQYCDDYITCDFPPAGEPQWDYDLFDCEESVVRCCKWVGDVLECPDWYWCSGHK